MILKQNTIPKNGIYIGKELSKILDVSLGDIVKIASPLDINIITKKIPSIEFEISGIYNFEIFNQYETPWEGTRVCKKKRFKISRFYEAKNQIKKFKVQFF